MAKKELNAHGAAPQVGFVVLHSQVDRPGFGQNQSFEDSKKTVREMLKAALADGKDVWTAGGADEAQIQALERWLQAKLPPSYRDFLASTGALNLDGVELAGIIDGDALELSGGSAYGETMWTRDDSRCLSVFWSSNQMATLRTALTWHRPIRQARWQSFASS